MPIWNACGSAALAAIAATASVWMMIGPLTAETSAPQTSAAKVWPTKRVQVVVPFAPGSATDLLPRTVFEHVAASVGQPIIIENRPGGGGAIGVGAVAKADPDGHTILVINQDFVVQPLVKSTTPYDPFKSFTAVASVAAAPETISVHPSVPATTMKELIALVRARPNVMHPLVMAK